MKKGIFLVILGICAVGCGRAPVLNVPQEFSPYVSKFEKLSTSYGPAVKVTDLVVQFGPMQTPTELGICSLNDSKPPTITIRQDTWAHAKDADREALLFHELGHCVLKRLHRSDLDPATGQPESLMNPYGVPGPVFDGKQSYYLTELFQNASN